MYVYMYIYNVYVQFSGEFGLPVHVVDVSDIGEYLVCSALQEGGHVALLHRWQVGLRQGLQRAEVAHLVRNQVQCYRTMCASPGMERGGGREREREREVERGEWKESGEGRGRESGEGGEREVGREGGGGGGGGG